MINTYTQLGYFDREVLPHYVIFNFRLTKEFGKNLEVSFMVNNMFNARKIHRNSKTGGYKNLPIDQYFGAELKLKL